MSRIPYAIIIMDGWGLAPSDYPRENNAILLAKTPYYKQLWENYPHATLKVSGRDVGLPSGVMGNSEVGHLNIGAGRIVWQDITRIDRAIEHDGLVSNQAFTSAMNRAKESGKSLHLMGLISDGAVHSVDRHYFALLRLAKKVGVPSARVFMHCFLDGRDTPPQSGWEYVAQLQKLMDEEQLGRIATVMGRYFAMDRDSRWDRVQKAYECIVCGKGIPALTSDEAITSFYKQDPRGDEFVEPRVIVGPDGKALTEINDGDEVIFFNFRADRARQLSVALTDPSFTGFERCKIPKIQLTTMTRYVVGLNAEVAFDPQNLSNTLGEVISAEGKSQLRIAETEKYAHVTYFFSGGREQPFENEDRILVPSPKVATYDEKPEMSAPEVAEKLEEAIRSGKYDLIVCNFANCDMVGHTGVIPAAVKAAETVDAALGRVIPAILDMGGTALITADHGNAEIMWNYDANCPDTQHATHDPTPVILVGEKYKSAKLRTDGRLADVAPTLLDTMGQTPPLEMDGQSLIG